jgi:hypothetical protein
MAALQVNTKLGLGPSEEQWRSDRKLWITADGERVVEDGDPDSAFLYATEGVLIPLSEARKHGLVEPEEEGAKQREEGSDKQRKGAGKDKGGGGEPEVEEVDLDTLKAMTLSELRELAEDLGLPTSGTKAELFERLAETGEEA